MHYIERQNYFWTKKANSTFLSSVWTYWADVHLHIVKLESGGYQLQDDMKKNLAANNFNLEKRKEEEKHTFVPKPLHVQ